MEGFTLDDAIGIISLIKHKKGFLILEGKEIELLNTLKAAERAHDQAIEFVPFYKEIEAETRRLKKSLQTTLNIIEKSKHINFAYLDSDLGLSDVDLKGLIRRAIDVIHKDAFIFESREEKNNRKIMTKVKPVSSSGIKAAVEVLRNFWLCETDIPFTESFSKDENSERNKPLTSASLFIVESMKCIDHSYTPNNCSYAMRTR